MFDVFQNQMQVIIATSGLITAIIAFAARGAWYRIGTK